MFENVCVKDKTLENIDLQSIKGVTVQWGWHSGDSDKNKLLKTWGPDVSHKEPKFLILSLAYLFQIVWLYPSVVQHFKDSNFDNDNKEIPFLETLILLNWHNFMKML